MFNLSLKKVTSYILAGGLLASMISIAQAEERDKDCEALFKHSPAAKTCHLKTCKRKPDDFFGYELELDAYCKTNAQEKNETQIGLFAGPTAYDQILGLHNCNGTLYTDGNSCDQ